MELSNLKLCFLAGTLGQGGAERQLFHSLQVLQQGGATLRVLSLDQNAFWEERIKTLGVPVVWVGQGQSKIKRLLQIIGELRRDPPTIFQSQHFYANPYVAVAARILRLPGIGALRGDGAFEVEDSGAVGGWLGLHIPRALLANSRSAIRYAVAHGVPPDRLHFLPNVVDTTHYSPRPAERRQWTTLLIAGRLTPVKRIDRFLDLLGGICSKTSIPIRGLVVGDGPLRKTLEDRAANLGLLPRVVEFRGAVSDLADAYREADIFVLTSETEGTPNVLLEASSSGLPVVATRVGGTNEVVREGKTGFLIDNADEAGMGAAILRLIGDEDLRLRMGAQGRRFVEENHSLARLGQILTDYYSYLLD